MSPNLSHADVRSQNESMTNFLLSICKSRQIQCSFVVDSAQVHKQTRAHI